MLIHRAWDIFLEPRNADERLDRVGVVLHLRGRVPPAHADTFGTGENQFTIEFVTIGDPGNPADTTGEPNPAGSVPYVYRIGKYEVPEHAIRRANAASAGSAGPLAITLDERGPDKPATRVSWFEAARFVNWLNADKGAPPAYKFDAAGDFQLWEPGDVGYTAQNPFRNTQARYFFRGADEWYKAAFYDPVSDQWFDYPNGMNTPPVAVASGTAANTAVYNQAGPADVMHAGGESPFGTVGQAGNVAEWDETEVDLINDDPLANRGFRGDNWGLISGDPTPLSSSFGHYIFQPSVSNAAVGFRVASIPEPSTLLLLLGCISFLSRRSRVRSNAGRVLLVVGGLCCLPSAATAETILFESATLGETGVTWQQAIDGEVPGENIRPTAFSGVRFELTQPVVTKSVGGHFVGPPDSDAEFFAAIVMLTSPDDFPDSDDLSTPDVLGTTLLDFPEPSEETSSEMELALHPGWYALVFGSGLFGASGSGGALSNSNDIESPDYIGFLTGFDWGGRLPSKRFVIKGTVVPEPSTLALAVLASVLLMVQTRAGAKQKFI